MTKFSRPGALAGVVLFAGLLLWQLFAPARDDFGTGPAVGDAITLAISVIVESLPFVFIGLALSIGVQLWLPPDFLIRRLPRTPVLRRLVLSVLGVLLPVCECGNVPLARGFMVRGLTVSDSMTFLLAAPILNPVTIITTYQAFGWSNGILISRVLGGFVIANFSGWMFSRNPAQHHMLTPTFQAACAVDHLDHDEGGRIRRSAALFAQESSAMLPALFIGAAIAGTIQVAISRDVLLTLGSNPVWSVLALMLLAFVIAICSNVDAFFALSLGSTFLPGSIVAFLVVGPMIDVKMIAMLRTTYTTRTLVQLTAVVALMSLSLGLVVNLVA